MVKPHEWLYDLPVGARIIFKQTLISFTKIDQETFRGRKGYPLKYNMLDRSKYNWTIELFRNEPNEIEWV